ncbi:MAG: hypothetical protein CMI53_00360 [Parcubacteria group bacterium]|nr:hypothetical protein [Parcubacteria group bacterium]|tara:strand:+ start:2218 stop:3306 length:1089 start_codon:yes stop_codon:yes gene_type:complete
MRKIFDHPGKLCIACVGALIFLIFVALPIIDDWKSEVVIKPTIAEEISGDGATEVDSENSEAVATEEVDTVSFVEMTEEERNDQIIRALIKASNDDDFDVKWAAAESLKELMPTFDFVMLTEVANSESYTVSATAALALEERLTEVTDEELIEFSTATSKGLRLAAINVLCQRSGEEISVALIVATTDEDQYVREAARQALAGMLPDDDLYAVLIKSAYDNDGNIHYDAIKALSKLSGPEVEAYLIRVFTDNSGWVNQHNAIEALVGRSGLVVEAALISALSHGYSGIREEAVELLAALPDPSPKVDRALVTALSDESEIVREGVVEALSNRVTLVSSEEESHNTEEDAINAEVEDSVTVDL